MNKDELRTQQKMRSRFASRLSANIKKYSRYIMSPGGNVTMVNINTEFAYELVEIFNETITEFLLDGEPVNFDQFGKYEIKIQESKRMQNPFTQNKEIFLPELKMIRFYPSLRLKERIRGNKFGRMRRKFGFKLSDDDNEDLDMGYGEDERLDIIEREDTEDAD